jgi:hypothetical protein
MDRRPTGARLEMAAVLALAFARSAFCAWRAVHQSITIDEAYTFNRFLNGSWWNIYLPYDANNHVLYSILAKLSVQLFGLSEFSLRLPSVISGFFLILGAYRVLALAKTSAAVRWIALAAISLHPLFLDFTIAARGYGLSLALMVWAVYFSMRRFYLLCGALLGLAVSANLTAAFPAAGLIVAVALLEEGSWKNRANAIALIVAPAETVLVAICFGALRTAEMKHFYAGEPQFREAMWQTVLYSIHVAHRSGLFGNFAAVRLIEYFLLPLLAMLIVVSAAAGRQDRPAAGRQNLRYIPLVALAAAMAGLVSGHYAFGLNYPTDRMALHLLLLFGLAWAIAADVLPRLRPVHLILAALLTIQFATQLETRYFIVWKEGMNFRAIAEMLQARSAGKAAASIRVSTSWPYQPAMEFYRQRLHIAEWQPVWWNNPTVLTDHDFYVLTPDDARAASGIRVIVEDLPNEVIVGER